MPSWDDDIGAGFLVDAQKILSPKEVAKVVHHWKVEAHRTISARLTLTIFRLSACAGLRASEIAGLLMKDVRTTMPHARIHVRAVNTKRSRHSGKGRSREVPLFWDLGTFEDLEKWKAFRLASGASPDDPFVAPISGCNRQGYKPSHLHRQEVWRRFKRACSILPEHRQKVLTCHSGRHSFVSLCLHGGISLPDVQRAVGHANPKTTSIYMHCSPDAGHTIGTLFDFEHEQPVENGVN